MRYIKEEVSAFVIMESMEEPKEKPIITKVVDTNNLFYVEFEAVLQDFIRVNRNKRFYPGKLMIPAFKAEHVLELLRNESFCCEAGHPDTDEVRRCVTIDPKNVCATILSMETTETMNRGVVRTIDDSGGYGTKMTKMVLQGLTPAFSLRALSKLKLRSDGASEVVSVPHVVCYDWVFVPSHKTAYMDRSKGVKVFDRDPRTGRDVVTSMVKPVTESNIQDLELYVREESSTVKIAQSALNVCNGGLILTDDYKHAVIKEGSNTYYIPIESYITADIRSYMSKL